MLHPWHVSVLIPARNEEELLPECLRSVLQACASLPAPVSSDVIVVVDSSEDGTLRQAQQMLAGRGGVALTNCGMVGQSRRIAAQLALERYRGEASRCWLANTDADCRVSSDWLVQQLLLAEQSFEAVAGTISVDSFAEHDAFVAERFRATYHIEADGSHKHVHGANLGIRADAYQRAGGWGDLVTAEDHDLWKRLESAGARRTSTSATSVVTSGRRVGRAPNGFAGALAAHNGSAA